METQIAVAAVAQCFGNNFTVPVDPEPVDHDSIEPGQRLDMAGAIAKELDQAPAVLEPRRHGADQTGRLAFVGDRRFGFDNDRFASEMDRNVERWPARNQGETEYSLHGIGAIQQRDPVAERKHRIAITHVLDRATPPRPAYETGEFADIGRDVRDRPTTIQSDQEAISLNTARDMDRFGIAVGKLC